MCNLESWQNFLSEKAIECELCDRETEVLQLKFASHTEVLSDNQTLDALEALRGIQMYGHPTYVLLKRSIYRRFEDLFGSCDRSNNCNNLSVWLHHCLQENYRHWQVTYSPQNTDFYYIQRCVESICYRELRQPNAFVRVRAPQKTGKTLMLNSVLGELQRRGYAALRYDFALGEGEIFNEYKRFIISFCAGVSELLNLEDCSAELWSDRLGVNRNATKYFNEYLLPQIDRPLVLGLDSLDRVLGNRATAQDFCSLLRAWHDRLGDRWANLRLIIVHSTEIYSQSGLAIDNSPLAGIGRIVGLPSFNREQIEILTQRYNLSMTLEEVDYLMSLTGGHPYLVRVALAYMAQRH